VSDTRLIRDSAGHKVTTLELFFDLVFVYGISQVTAYLADDHSVLGFARGLLLAALLWWAWVAYSWLGTSVRVDQGLVQVSMFVAMAAIMILAVLMPDFFDDTRGTSLAMLAAAAYVVVRIMHLALFYVAGRDDPGITGAVLRLARTVVIAAVLLIGGAYLGGAWQMALVAVAVAIDVLGPYLSGGEGWRLALAHFAERHGLIVIIALGEGIVAIGVGAAGMPVNGQLLTTAILGVVVACTLWVAYFDGVAESLEATLDRRSGVDRVTAARDVYSLMHFLLVAGLILVALAMKSALKNAESGWMEPLAGYAAFALGLGLFQFLMGMWVMRRRAGARTSLGEPLVAAGALLLIPMATVIPAAVGVAVTALLALVWRSVRAPVAQPT
jgi:low temperature requirement protein LtrA